MMKGVMALTVLFGAALLIAGCAIPLGDDLVITRDGNTGIIYVTDYNLETYVPLPSKGQQPVTAVNNRGDLDLSVVWKDQSGNDLPGLTIFGENTVYQAEIKLRPKAGYGFDPSIPFGYHPGRITYQNDDRAGGSGSVRTVTVTYNNSDVADITFITDYNLQSYVPIPMAGEKPVRAASREGVAVTVEWTVETLPDSGVFDPIPADDSYTFVEGAVYRALIHLTVNSGSRFREVGFDYPAGTVGVPPGVNSGPDTRDLTVTYRAAEAPVVISDLSLTPYIPKPINGGQAVLSFTGAQYTGKVVWKDSGNQTVLAGPFQSGRGYTAEVTLTPALGYTFTGVGQDTFTHTGAQRASNPANSGTIRIDFLVTASPGGLTVVYDLNLTGRVPQPAYGVTPVKSIAGSQYTGAVVWKKTVTQAPLIGSFQSDTEYTAVLTLTPAPGYTFTGLGQNAFTHADAVGTVTNLTSSGTVTINFPPAVFSNYSVTTFGPVGTEGSALKVMMERSDDDRAVTIDLSPGTETVIPDSVNLVGELNSPANVTIDGHGRVLQVLSPGTLLTVSENVTLTLRNLTLQGSNVNTTPLITIRPRGRLILDGVILADNPTTGNTGGVWVNGGALVMNQGSAIKKMTVTIIPSNNNNKAGAVVIDNNGRFTMHGGVIGGDAADGNTVSGCTASGGGVLVLDGVFDMYGGTIGGNKAESGGGVAVLTGGTFNQYGGTIKENRVEGDGGGGVNNEGIFIMDGAEAVIEGNRVEDSGSGGGGGVKNQRIFLMRAGTIQENEVQGPGPIVTGSGFGGGVLNSGTFDMYGGTIKGNKAESGGGGTPLAGGVFNRATFNMYGGTIGGGEPGDANRGIGDANYILANGVVVYFADFVMAGGTITGNTDILATNDYGVWVHYRSSAYSSEENFKMGGSARITTDNRVFLYSEKNGTTTVRNRRITIISDLTAPGYVANIIMKNDPAAGTIRLLQAGSEARITANYDKFLYDGAPEHINSTPVQDGGLWYGTYKP